MDRAMKSKAIFAYADNYLIDACHGIIMDVEASRAIRQAEVGAARKMIARTEQRFAVGRRFDDVEDPDNKRVRLTPAVAFRLPGCDGYVGFSPQHIGLGWCLARDLAWNGVSLGDQRRVL
jgi:hypothetical protein